MEKIIQENTLTLKAVGSDPIWVKVWTDGFMWSHGKAFSDITMTGYSRELSKLEFIKLCGILEEMGW